MSDREPGLARAGRADTEYEFMALECAQIGILACRAGAYRAFAQIDFLESRARGGRIEIEQRALRNRETNCPFDIALAEIVTALDLLVEAFEHAARAFAGIARAFDRHLVAARVRDHAKAALDQRQVLPVLAEQRRGAAIVVEGEHGLRGRGVVGLAGGRNDPIFGRQVAQCLRLRALRVTGILPRFAWLRRARRT